VPERTRTEKPIVNGFYQNKSTGNTINYQRWLIENTITDWISPSDGLPLQINKYLAGGGITPLTGENSTHRWGSFLPAGLWIFTNHISDSDIGIPPNSYFATRLIGITNPNRSEVDIPVAMAELRELPSLIKGWGENIFKRIAAGNLTLEFAIKPLVSDILSMCNLVSIVEKRVEEIQQLMQSGLRRKRNLGRYSSSDTLSISMQTGVNTQLNLSTSTNRMTQVKVWGFVEYKPTAILKSLRNDEIVTKARNAALGLYLDGYTAWNLIPWSWFVDWFFNFGDWLSIQRNEIPVSISEPLIMKEYFTLLRHRKTNTSAHWPSQFSTSLLTKTRAKSSASISTKMSLLSQRQWSILGSLAVLKVR
jgi:hypothetical protein